MKEAQKQLEQPFPQEEVLKEKTKRLEELDMDSSDKNGVDEEILKKEDQKRVENVPLKQSRFLHFCRERVERHVGLEY